MKKNTHTQKSIEANRRALGEPGYSWAREGGGASEGRLLKTGARERETLLPLSASPQSLPCCLHSQTGHCSKSRGEPHCGAKK